ncbi:hypothetical protein V6N13_088961 [Hibiscus sabdariffa]|uniref:Uncharacterized protein n=1 Tax=Hibiscus sabdariffa TaxID=183260 RepID=A0ABR2G1F3_9ROSI
MKARDTREKLMLSSSVINGVCPNKISTLFQLIVCVALMVHHEEKEKREEKKSVYMSKEERRFKQTTALQSYAYVYVDEEETRAESILEALSLMFLDC